LITSTITSSYFFFQAEDGIRDRNVTGVQTCALPICPGRDRPTTAVGPPPATNGGQACTDRCGPGPTQDTSDACTAHRNATEERCAPTRGRSTSTLRCRSIPAGHRRPPRCGRDPTRHGPTRTPDGV